MTEDKTEKKPVIILQLIAGFSASLSSFATGTAYGWSSPVGVKLTSNDTSSTPVGKTFTPESDEIAWITSCMIIGIIITSFGASYLADKIGRKWTLMCSAVFFIISYIMFIFACDVGIIYAGRIIQGFGVGIVLTTLPQYIAEVSSDEIRGAMGSFLAIFISVGTLYTYAWGAYVSYFLLQLICLAVPIVFIVLFFFMPESPFYLVAKGRKEHALSSLKYLRRQQTEELEESLEKIKAIIDESASNKGSVRDIFRNRASTKAFIMCFGLVSLQQLNGSQAVTFNAQLIFEKAHLNIDSGLASIIVVIFQTVFTFIASILVDRLGRRILLLASLAVKAVALAILGLYFYLNQSGVETSSFSWITVVALIIYVAFSAIGLLPVPFVIIGEVFTPNIKLNASALLAISGAALGFATTRCYGPMLLVGMYFPFWIYGLCCVLGFGFVWIFILETKGKSFEEIQQILNKN